MHRPRHRRGRAQPGPRSGYTDNTNAGTATASYTYAGDANHTGSDDTETFEIDQATSSTVVTFEAGPYVYRGTEFTATAVVTGAGGLNESVAVVLTGDCTNVTSTDGCTATATYVGDANHTGSSDTKSITILKADATIDVHGYSGIYDGDPHGATGTATGVLAEALDGLDLGDSFTNVPGGTANWTFTDVTGNYNDDSGSVAIVISKADATIVVTGYDVTYDAERAHRHRPATGVDGETLVGLDVADTTHTNAGDLPGRPVDLHRCDRQLQRRQRLGR